MRLSCAIGNATRAAGYEIDEPVSCVNSLAIERRCPEIRD